MVAGRKLGDGVTARKIGDTISPMVAELKLVIEALTLAYKTLKGLKDSALSRKDKKRITQEAERIIKVATDEHVDRYIVEPRRMAIDAHRKRRAAPGRWAPAKKKKFAMKKKRAAKRKKR